MYQPAPQAGDKRKSGDFEDDSASKQPKYDQAGTLTYFLSTCTYHEQSCRSGTSSSRLLWFLLCCSTRGTRSWSPSSICTTRLSSLPRCSTRIRLCGLCSTNRPRLRRCLPTAMGCTSSLPSSSLCSPNGTPRSRGSTSKCLPYCICGKSSFQRAPRQHIPYFPRMWSH